MSEFGFKIQNIEASTLFEYNAGLKEHYEYKEAMFANSLFKEYLEQNGLQLYKDDFTRDIICLEFNYSTKSFQQEMQHLIKLAKSTKMELRKAKIKREPNSIHALQNKLDKIVHLLYKTKKNRWNYVPLSKEELRKKFYKDGVDMKYISKNRKGEIKKIEKIHYKMLYRSTGKAKKGSCIFIRDKFFDKSLNFLRMGIQLPTSNAMLVEISAYSSLISSGIVDKLKINPNNILILKDINRYFKTNVISVELNDKKQCVANKIENYPLKNTLFDGQALIDSEIFPDNANGYILLRQHFCKMAAFKTNIQQFYKEYFGAQYETATVTDMFGNKHFVKDIQLITTDNAMKWLKFNVSYNYWCNWVEKNGCFFGIVKTAHKSKLGMQQKMSYQMVNSLDNAIMENVVATSAQYIENLKKEDSIFLNYLKKNINFSNDYEVLLSLCEYNPDFINSTYFRLRKKKIIESIIYKFRTGEIIQNAENLTVVGSPYAMLLYSTCGNPNIVDMDDTFCCEQGAIQCFTNRFFDDEYLAFFRSPFNSKNNLMYLHNVYNETFNKYFDFGKQIIAINMIGTDAQDRCNGMDMDSDFGYTTNQSDIVSYAKICYKKYPTIINNIPKDKNIYNNTTDDFAKIDHTLAKSQADIGESSNLAQLAQSYTYAYKDKKFQDYVCILSVLAQIAIDNSKRQFDIDLTKEIDRIKQDMDIKKNGYPVFWKIIKNDLKEKKINHTIKCPMNYLMDFEFKKVRNLKKAIPLSEFFIKHPLQTNRKTCRRIEELIEKYSLKLLYELQINDEADYENSLLLRNDFEYLVSELQHVRISTNYIDIMSYLIDRTFILTDGVRFNNKIIGTKLNKNKPLLMKVLYSVNQKSFLECFKKSIHPQ